MVPARESLTVEFKSDQKPLHDKDLLEAVVCLANSEGGELWLGVEDSGVATGLHASRGDGGRLGPLIANRTQPSVAVRVETHDVQGVTVALIRVPKMRQIVGTTDGTYTRRRIKMDGSPECTPMYSHEFTQRQASLGQIDWSAASPEATLEDLDPLERTRLRRVVELFQGDRSLLALSDEELDGALGLTVSGAVGRQPTMTGLLLLGKEERLRQIIPAHDIGFQLLDGTEVRTNEFFRAPLLRVFEEVEARFGALKAAWGSKEFEDGLFRVSIPRYEQRAFREAFLNAIIHRDYTRLGAAHVRFDDAGLTISNPGGFVEGVTIANLLTTDPRPRNPLLADVMKRLGLVERTGRGVDRIFEGMLRFGRPEPDYSRSSSTGVVLLLANAQFDADFLRMIIREEQRLGKSLPIDSLIMLSRLRRERRLSAQELLEGPLTAQFHSRGTIHALTEAGLVEAHGTGKGRTYTLSAKVYQAAGELVGYIRQSGFDSLQQEQMVLKLAEKERQIKRSDVMKLCRIDKDQAARLLRRLVEAGELRMHGQKRGAYYERPSKL